MIRAEAKTCFQKNVNKTLHVTLVFDDSNSNSAHKVLISVSTLVMEINSNVSRGVSMLSLVPRGHTKSDVLHMFWPSKKSKVVYFFINQFIN